MQNSSVVLTGKIVAFYLVSGLGYIVKFLNRISDFLKQPATVIFTVYEHYTYRRK